MNSYAEVLDSYLIPAEEGFMDKVKSAGKAAIDAIIRAIRWLKDKISSIINKIKNLKVYDKREIDKIKKESLEAQFQKKRADGWKNLYDNEHNDKIAAKEEQHAASATLSAMKISVRESGQLSVYINRIDRQIIDFYRQLPDLIHYVNKSGKEVSNVPEIRHRYHSIDSNLLSDLKSAIDNFIEMITDLKDRKSNTCIAFSFDTIVVSRNCLNSIRKVLDELEKIASALKNISPSNDGEQWGFNLVSHTCTRYIEYFTSINAQVSRIINLADSNRVPVIK